MGRGWLCTQELGAGDELCGHDGQVVQVESVRETGELTTVYNVRIADFHTYFVGSQHWGFSVWSHHADYIVVQGPDGRYRLALEDGSPLPRDLASLSGSNPGELAGMIPPAAPGGGRPHAPIQSPDGRGWIDPRTGAKFQRQVIDSKGRTVYPDGATLKNDQGKDVAIPPGHIMSPRDPAMNSPPILRRGGLADPRGFTDAERQGFLAGNDGGTLVTPHHRHHIPVRDGGVLDELPRRGQPEGDVHMGGSPSRHPNDGRDGRNGSIFNEPGGSSLHKEEVESFFKEKGRRLVRDPKTDLWVDPLGQ